MTTVLAVAVVLVITSGAVAATHHGGSQAQIVRLRKQVTHLERQLRSTTLARNKWRAADAAAVASLQSSQEQLGTANQQVAILQGRIGNYQIQVGSLQAETKSQQTQIGTLQGQVASLQGQLAAIPAPIAVAVEQIRREVAYQEEQNKLPYSHGRLVSQAAMEYVVGHVSASAYGYLALFSLPLPSATADAALGLQAGICGNAAITFAAILEHFGYPVRSAQFYYTDPAGPAGPGAPDSHIAVGVYYDDAWHYFDPTFGVYWTDANGNVLSITDVRASGGTEVKDDSSFTNLAENYFYGDGTAFLTDPATKVVIGAQPLTG